MYGLPELMAFDRLVFVTGLSGAGKSQTMKTFEDLGFYCIDNLPPSLVDQTLVLLERAQKRLVAVALDVRTGGALGDALPILERYTAEGNAKTTFLDARDDVLIRRYSETRRRHPFASAGSLTEAIGIERAALAPLRAFASSVIDTTSLTHAELKTRIGASVAPETPERRLDVTIVAFGYKYGLPLDLDLLFDVRFLRNPNYDDALRPRTGADPSVAEYVEADPALQPFVKHLFSLLDFLMPQFRSEGKSQVTIGIGCTGGRHRSVYIARRVFEHLENTTGIRVRLDTRDTTR